MRRLIRAALAVSIVAACADPGAESEQTPTTVLGVPSTTSTTPSVPTQVLVFHATAEFAHNSIPAGVTAITELGENGRFVVTATDGSSVFTDPGLLDFDVVVFLNTTGDVLDAAEEAAMEGFIRSGKGFVGVHAATDTEYDWGWYGGLVGAYFDGHPEQQTATVRSTGSGHPAGEGLPESFERFDEWYNFTAPPVPGVVVLATLDETTYEGGTMGDEHPIAWAQEYDGGRSFYTGMGHTVETYSEPLFRSHLGNGIAWAAGEG